MTDPMTQGQDQPVRLLPEPCDRARIMCERMQGGLGMRIGTVLTQAHYDQLVQHLRIALDTEVEAGGPYLNNGWNRRPPPPAHSGGDNSLSQSQPCGDASALPANPFIQWNGGENPAPGKVVDVKFRNGETGSVWSSEDIGWGHPWSDDGIVDHDIIAYRIIPNSDGEEG